jgi:hypothetical protein
VRPDSYNYAHKESVEVKNYDLTNNSKISNFVNKTVKQINERIPNLPTGSKQKIEIDIRGQNIPKSVQDKIKARIKEKTKVTVEIDFY